jgi:E3 ubiquitin-protein ligase RNF213
MDLQEGTAVNQALKENIFAIIPCIINRIPIFICGKPGCSKSMAISLVF